MTDIEIALETDGAQVKVPGKRLQNMLMKHVTKHYIGENLQFFNGENDMELRGGKNGSEGQRGSLTECLR